MWHNPRQLNILAAALGAGAALALCAAMGCWLMQQPVFALRMIRIDGDLTHLNLPSVRAAVSQLRNRRLHTHFFNLDLNEARAIFEAMPWVQHATLRRVWPNQLALTLTEYKALGIWQADWLVSVEGERFAANLAEAGDELPALSGPAKSEKEMVRRYKDFVRWFAPLGLKPVSVTLSDRRAWTVELSNGTRVELGRDERASNAHSDALEQRSRRLVTAWKAATAQWGEAIQYADLRYPNGFAIYPAPRSGDESAPEKSKGGEFHETR